MNEYEDAEETEYCPGRLEAPAGSSTPRCPVCGGTDLSECVTEDQDDTTEDQDDTTD